MKHLDLLLAIRGSAEAIGLNIRELAGLLYLEREGSSVIGAVMAGIEASPAYTSKVVGTLEKEGYLVRTIVPDDLRCFRVELTGLGKEMAMNVKGAMERAAKGRIKKGLNP